MQIAQKSIYIFGFLGITYKQIWNQRIKLRKTINFCTNNYHFFNCIFYRAGLFVTKLSVFIFTRRCLFILFEYPNEVNVTCKSNFNGNILYIHISTSN